MSTKKLYNLIVPTVTFFLGIIFQLLLEQWIVFKEVISLAMIVIIVSLAFIFTATLTMLDSIEKRFNTVDSRLDDITARTGLRVEFIRDNIDGNSYRRSTDLIEKAKVSLTFVAPWQPFGKYQADTVPDPVEETSTSVRYTEQQDGGVSHGQETKDPCRVV